VLLLQSAEDSDIATAYLDVFESAWAVAVPAE